MSSISIRTKINRLDSKKRPFLSLSRDIDEKDIFGGQFVSFYFRQTLINAVNEV